MSSQSAAYLYLWGEFVPVDGEPAVSQESILVPGLWIVDDDVGEVPRLHLPDPAVVVPDLDVLQVPEGSKKATNDEM